jgi:predicted MFS family arabinose efflux permease
MSTAEESSDPNDSDEPDQPGAALGRAFPSMTSPPPANDVGQDRLFTPAFVGLLGMQAAYGFSFSMFFLLPKYLATTGETASRIGFVMAGFGVACVLTIPFLPAIVRTFGRRGALMAATLLLAAAAATFALVDRPGWMAIPLRASEGVTWTIMFSTALALTAEMAPPFRLAQAIGLAGAASLIMNAVAPAIGEPLADRFGYRWAFALAAVAAVGAAALARRLPDAHRRGAALGGGGAHAPETTGPEIHRVLIYVVFGVAGLAFSSLFTFLAPFALDRGVHAIRAFFIGYTGSALAVRVLGGRTSDRLGHGTVAAAALLVYGFVVASTGLVGPHHLLALGSAFGLAHGAAFPALMALLLKSAPTADRPRVLGIANGAMSVGVSAVFPAGLLVARVGYPAMFAIAGGLTAASAALIWRRRRVGR